MATNTPKLTLPKPDANDNFNRAAYNALIDAIDNNVGTKTQAAETHAADSVKHVTAEDKALWSAKASTAVATQSANGLMTAADKLALDNAQKFKLTADNGRAKDTAPADLDAITTSGTVYTTTSTLNTPVGVTVALVETYFGDSASSAIQRATVPGTNSVYTRVRTSSGWRAWQRVIDGSTLGGALMGNKFIDSSNANFVGKISGSTTVNPHIARFHSASNILNNPGSGLERSDSSYANMASINGINEQVVSTTNGGIAQVIFSFNILEHVQRAYGTIPGATTADKVSWLKSNLSKLTFNWWGFGSSPAGNKANLSRWDASTNSWTAPPLVQPSGIVAKLVSTPFVGTSIDSNGFAHFLAYAESSDGTTVSVINTDYVELNVELSTGIWNNTPAFTWINATYQNSWASFDADRALKYAKDEKGTVTLRGTIKGGTVGTATPVMTLPAGFRPLESSLSIPITVSGGIGELQIQSSGAVSIASASYGASPNPTTQAHIYVRFFAGQ